MLKVRVIPIVLYNGQVVVKSIRFDKLRNIGNPVNVVRVHNARDVDELVFLDISRYRDKYAPDLEIFQDIAAECFMPLTIGGGITNLSDIRNILLSGADKVSINSGALQDLNLVSLASEKFGSQCIVAAVDLKKDDEGIYRVFQHHDRKILDRRGIDWVKQLEDAGAGEILLTSVDTDGTMNGFDCDLIEQICRAVTIPVIVAGGAGRPDHFAAAVAAGASAVAAGSIFHFTQYTPLDVKRELANGQIPVRIY